MWFKTNSAFLTAVTQWLSVNVKMWFAVELVAGDFIFVFISSLITIQFMTCYLYAKIRFMHY